MNQQNQPGNIPPAPIPAQGNLPMPFLPQQMNFINMLRNAIRDQREPLLFPDKPVLRALFFFFTSLLLFYTSTPFFRPHTTQCAILFLLDSDEDFQYEYYFRSDAVLLRRIANRIDQCDPYSEYVKIASSGKLDSIVRQLIKEEPSFMLWGWIGLLIWLLMVLLLAHALFPLNLISLQIQGFFNRPQNPGQGPQNPPQGQRNLALNPIWNPQVILNRIGIDIYNFVFVTLYTYLRNLMANFVPNPNVNVNPSPSEEVNSGLLEAPSQDHVNQQHSTNLNSSCFSDQKSSNEHNLTTIKENSEVSLRQSWQGPLLVPQSEFLQEAKPRCVNFIFPSQFSKGSHCRNRMNQPKLPTQIKSRIRNCKVSRGLQVKLMKQNLRHFFAAPSCSVFSMVQTRILVSLELRAMREHALVLEKFVNAFIKAEKERQSQPRVAMKSLPTTIDCSRRETMHDLMPPMPTVQAKTYPKTANVYRLKPEKIFQPEQNQKRTCYC